MAESAPVSPPTSPTHFYRRRLPDTCLSFSSEAGKQVFVEAFDAGYMNCYFGLAEQFRTQDEPAFCGLSTLVMVLNTLEVDPKKVWKSPWRWYHESMLDCCVPLEVVKSSGISLPQFACLAACNGLNARVVQATEQCNEDALRDAVKHCSSSADEVIVASYSREMLKQTGDGHFSPIGGYHPGKDLVLILDTARFKYPPHWVPVSLLWQAMQTLDSSTGMPRGYSILSKTYISPLLMFKLSPCMSIGLPSGSAAFSEASAFHQKWDQCISEDLAGDTTDEKAVINGATRKLLSCLKQLSQDSQILCTQIDVKHQEQLSQDHRCAAEDLLASLENTLMFEIVSDYMTDDSELRASVERSGRCSISTRPGCCCSNTAESVISNCAFKPVTSRHFVAMLLLSWPVQKCSCRGDQVLQRAISDQLASSDDVLQNEVSLLRQQFHLVQSYRSSCQDSNVLAVANTNTNTLTQFVIPKNEPLHK